MQRPRFAEILYTRRKELGLSLSQASKVLKFKEGALAAFENGDFANIPKSGYAQGMLSSYARYLGLNPHEIVDLFQQDLEEFERAVVAGRNNQFSGYSLGSDDSSYPLNYPTNTLLQNPTVLGSSDAYTSTSEIRSRRERWQQSSPLVNSYQNQPYDDSFTTTSSGYGIQTDNYSRYTSQEPRPYTSRVPGSSPRTGRSNPNRRTVQPAGYEGQFSPEDTIISRPITQQYTDDLSYSNTASSFQSASSHEGRRNSRNIASTQRPSVNRRNTRRQGRPTPEKQRREGFAGVIDAISEFFSDRTRAIATLTIIVGILLTMVIVLSVRSCAAAKMPQPTPPTQEVVQEEKKDTKKEEESKKNAEEAARAAEEQKKQQEEEEEKDVVVVVKVADGKSAWIDINQGGKNLVAKSVTGPWEETFKVDQALTISTTKPGDVVVERNGKPVEFGKVTAGTAKITIDAPKPKKEETSDSKEKNNETQEATQNSN